jgi:hypothetical protein
MTTFGFAAAGCQGPWQFLIRHGRIAAYERYRSSNRAEFCRSPPRLVPDSEPGGRLVDDFHFVKGERMPRQWSLVSTVGAHSVPLGGRR